FTSSFFIALCCFLVEAAIVVHRFHKVIKLPVNIEGLIKDRQNLYKALQAMDKFLVALGVDVSALESAGAAQKTLISAIKTIAAELQHNITKATVLEALRRLYPQLNANPQSVAAALLKMTQGNKPFLY